jgi:hypothetical protein
MRKIISQLREFWKEDFHLGIYLGTAIFLTVALILNYSLGLADRWLYPPVADGGQLLRYFAFFGIPYFVVLGLQALWRRSGQSILAPQFWFAIGLAIVLVCCTAWFPWHVRLAKHLLAQPHWNWGVKVFWSLKRIPFTILPLLLYWWVVEREKKGCYGLWGGNLNLKPYFLMLLIVLPGIVAVSFLPDFLKAYPFYRPTFVEDATIRWGKVGAFELSYGLSFLVVEWVFRGFLVIGMAKWLGPRAVLPMVAMYCVIHFGKPMGEAIAAVFGGYILGVVALKSRSIWGGVAVHLGVAWMMEMVAWLQIALR